MKTKEVWKEAPGFDGYFVSSHGRVWSCKRNRFLTHQKMGHVTHWAVRMRKDGETRTVYVGRLMAMAFLENPKNYPVVYFLNGNKDDLFIENLSWGSFSDACLNYRSL